MINSDFDRRRFLYASAGAAAGLLLGRPLDVIADERRDQLAAGDGALIAMTLDLEMMLSTRGAA